MKNKAFLTGILGVALVFATLLFTGCPTEEEEAANPFKGGWKGGSTVRLYFDDNGSFSMSKFENFWNGDFLIPKNSGSGSYTYSGNTAALTFDGESGSYRATISGTTLTLSGVTFTKQ
jgi:hypothetical protein